MQAYLSNSDQLRNSVVEILKYLILVFVVLYSFESQAQNFINPGARWDFNSIYSSGTYVTYSSWKYQNDTIIQGVNYQIIKRKCKNLYNSTHEVFEYDLSSFLLRSSGDSLLYSEINFIDEHLLYDFTPVIGNTWDVSSFCEGVIFTPTTPQYVETIGFGDTLINGSIINWVEVISLNPDSLLFDGRIYNHYGKQMFLPYWNDGEFNNQAYIWDCYIDDSLGLISYSYCQDYETLGNENINQQELYIIPDSKNNRLIIDKIDSHNVNVIVIYDLMGREVFTKDQISSNQIDISLPSGIYICKIYIGKMNFSQKFLW